MSRFIRCHARSVPRMNFHSAPARSAQSSCQGTELKPLRKHPATGFLQSSVGFGFLLLLFIYFFFFFFFLKWLQLNDSQWLIHLLATK